MIDVAVRHLKHGLFFVLATNFISGVKICIISVQKWMIVSETDSCVEFDECVLFVLSKLGTGKSFSHCSIDHVQPCWLC